MKILVMIAHNYKTVLFDKASSLFVEKQMKLGHEVRVMRLYEMDFDVTLRNGYKSEQSLEKSILEFQNNFIWADHIELYYPIWWGQAPARFKALLERSLLPGKIFIQDQGSKKFSAPKAIYMNKKMHCNVTLSAPKFVTLFMPDKKSMNYIFKVALKVKTSFNYYTLKQGAQAEQIDDLSKMMLK
jgi:NAD(P)H dehydrogenase (quinone)